MSAGDGVLDQRLEPGVVADRQLAGRAEDADLETIDCAQGLMHDRLDLKAQGQHVGCKTGLHDLIGVDAGGGEVRQTLVEKA
jgi:hypothetical protein